MSRSTPDPATSSNPAASPNRTSPSRRQVLLGAAATLVVAGCSGGTDQSTDGGGDRSTSTSTSTSMSTAEAPTSTSTSAPASCLLTPELTAGPYYLDGHLARADITEDRPGTPMTFRVKVLAHPECTPVEGAAVDIWHCDAGGEYSGFNGNSLAATAEGGTNDKRYLRGVQLTDRDGIATFRTIFPGWYEGRTVHIHLKVIEGGSLASTYTGGHVAHVGQAFFEEAATATILGGAPYRGHTGTRTTNDQDSIYQQAGPTAVSVLTERPNPSDGLIGDFSCTIDPDATPAAAPMA